MSRTARIALVMVALLGVAGAVLGPRLAVGRLETRVREALGDRIAVGHIALGWQTLEITDLRLPAPADWPVPDALRVRRVVLRPRLTTLLGRRVVIDDVEIDGLYLAARRRPGVPLEVLPGIDLPHPRRDGARGPARDDAAERRGVSIGRVAFYDGAFDLFDATVASPPHRTAVSALEATVTDIETPALGRRSRVRLEARLDGPRRPGQLSVEGTVALGAGTARLRTTMTGVDLAAFRPWLRREGTAIRGGVVDVAMESRIRDGRIHAPGRLTIRKLSFDGDRGLMDRLLALPRDAAFRAVAGGGGRMRVRFVLEGPVDAPRLVITDAAGREVVAALGGVVGAAPAGVAEGAGAVGQAGATGLEATARGAARAIERLFRDRR